MWKRLYRGKDILIGVLWTAAAATTWCSPTSSGTPPTGGATRKFLLSDPWEREVRVAHVRQPQERQLRHAGTGYIDDIYY